MNREELKAELKQHIIKYLNLLDLTPEDIKDDELLFGETLGLDSIDSIELIVMLEREYKIKIKDHHQIIAEAFQNNPSVLAVIKNDGDHKSNRLKALASYAFDTAIIRDGVYLSSDNQGVAICYSFNNKSESIIDYWNQAKLVFNAIGITRVFKILTRDSYIKKQRPAEHDFLYFWFFGATDKGKGGLAAKELKNARSSYIFRNLCREKQTCIPAVWI